MEGLKIRPVRIEDGENRAIYDMLQLIDKKENGFGNAGYGMEWDDFPQFVHTLLRQKNDPDVAKGYVPQTTFWLFDGEEVIGFSKMRSYLTEALRKKGGHIGYGIRKDKRKMGYGKKLLALTLQEIKRIGVEQVLLTCDASNFGSRKIIEWNNGILEKEENHRCYYWITVS